jgi:hypothetical protein
MMIVGPFPFLLLCAVVKLSNHLEIHNLTDFFFVTNLPRITAISAANVRCNEVISESHKNFWHFRHLISYVMYKLLLASYV